MSFQVSNAGAPEGMGCTYGTSKLLFRGPKRSLDQPYIAFLGGSETFGRFVDRPFASLIESRLSRTCVNLGSPNGGLDTLRSDPELMQIASQAATVVLQVPGAHGQSNRFFRVHPRRNDRFVQATPHLRRVYPEVDFTRFHFVRHLLTVLSEIDVDRFEMVRRDLQTLWLRRMQSILQRLKGNALLLWLSHEPAGDEGTPHSEPTWVTRAMLEKIAPNSLGLVNLQVRTAGAAGELSEMRFADLQRSIAEQMISPDTHRQIADQLAKLLDHQ